jgi:hypothetical protein
MKCAQCQSCAINPHLHGRDDTRLDLCDVCWWRNRAEAAQSRLAILGEAGDALARFAEQETARAKEWARLRRLLP